MSFLWPFLRSVSAVFGVEEVVHAVDGQKFVSGSVDFGDRDTCDRRTENDPVLFADRGLTVRVRPIEEHDDGGSNRGCNVHRPGVVGNK